MNPTDDTLQARQRSVAAEEAAALREEVVRWVRDGEAGAAAAEVVRELVRDGLAEQVELALNSRDLGQTLGDELRARLSERFADDLRAVVVAEVKRALAAGILDQAALNRLGEEIRSELRGDRTRRGGAGPGGSERGPRGWDPRWVLGAAAAVFLLSAGLLAGVWWMARAPVERTEVPSAADDRQTVQPVATDDDGDAAPTAEPVTVNPLQATWERTIAVSPPAGVEIGGDEFDCWYPARTRDELGRLYAAAQLSSTSIEGPLRNAFATCTGAYAPTNAAGAAVFAAQAAAHRALGFHAGEGWVNCAVRPDPAPAVASFSVDGVRGNGTYALLNAYLSCRDLGAAVAFNNGSDVTDYLFVTWVALEELSAR